MFPTLVFDYTLWIVILGTSCLGFVSGVLGSFAVLKKQSLLGDAMSHAALPGIAIAFLLTHSKHTFVLLIGAIIAGWIGALLMMVITRNTILKEDAALGLILSVFFGFGLVLLTYIQNLPIATQSGLHTFLFGNAATLLLEDVLSIFGLGVIAILGVFLFWKEFKIITFDPNFANSLGFPIKRLDIFLTTLIVISIVIGLQTVGVVLMSAMLIAPAAAARQWTDRLGRMVLLSGVIGGVSGVSGALLSSLTLNIPTGPTIVLVVSAMTGFSLLFAPNRGLVFGWWRHRQHQLMIKGQMVLSNMLLFSESHDDPFHPHDLGALKAIGKGALNSTMIDLEKKGWVYSPEKNVWGLTKKGYGVAIKLNGEGVSDVATS
ncbi:ABC transporter [Candidatus Marinamargulisbacteria bacterium SCGC AG-439-L15]|nr:ABC transporter [Candidatus Marinamargulisbacteria bacterium SCGC AG-439-L15]